MRIKGMIIILIALFCVSCGKQSDNSSARALPEGNSLKTAAVSSSWQIKEAEIAEKSEWKEDPPGSILLSVVSADSENVVYSVTNNRSEEILIANPWACRIEKEQEGIWYTLVRADIAWTDEAYPIAPGKTLEKSFGFVRGYGRLGKGHYRLIVPVRFQEKEYLLGAEFDVD